jgi:hypothetical protein
MHSVKLDSFLCDCIEAHPPRNTPSCSTRGENREVAAARKGHVCCSSLPSVIGKMPANSV